MRQCELAPVVDTVDVSVDRRCLAAVDRPRYRDTG
jgi:hypothetical protein